ncbi:MAG: tripartite tricarboxylate transporter substrate binding protein [Alphaproteobacteria bacterium]|nr:tripartite tricarboxylate transporter substrate binding protein [Alphaproteobacteria bacterium]
MWRRGLAVAGLLWIGIVVCGTAAAQDYPTRPVKIVVPFPAGGGTDALTRVVAKGLEQRLGQPFIIENRGGAGTTLGATAVARSAPDGYTIMVGTASTFAVAPGLYKRLQYDPTKDFTQVMLFATVPFVLVVNPALGVSSVKELIARAKDKPGDLAFASAGVGAVHHIYAELLMHMTGIKMRHVPYRGGGAALNDVVAGHVPIYFADAGPAATLIREGKLKALGVTTARRASHLPDVPTLHEAGVTGYEANTWQMLVGPARMPDPIVQRLNGALAEFMRTPEAQSYFTGLGMQPMTGTPAQAHEHVRAESERWTKIIRGIGLSID